MFFRLISYRYLTAKYLLPLQCLFTLWIVLVAVYLYKQRVSLWRDTQNNWVFTDLCKLGRAASMTWGPVGPSGCYQIYGMGQERKWLKDGKIRLKINLTALSRPDFGWGNWVELEKRNQDNVWKMPLSDWISFHGGHNGLAELPPLYNKKQAYLNT